MFLDYKSSKIYFEVEGDGPALILLHGFMEDLSMWDAFVPELVSKCKVIRIDLLGHGKSDCIAKVHSMEIMAEAVFAILQHLNIHTAKVIGHSMGGYVALALAEYRPGLVKDLVLLNSTFEADSLDRKELRSKAILQAEESKEAYQKLIRLSFPNLFAPESTETFKSQFEIALNKALQTPVCGYTAALEGMKLRRDRFDVFTNVQGRKIIVAGKKDNLINAESLRKKTANSSIELLEFSEGHMSHIENKSELTYFLKRFIEK
jgi:pimeloyl-ACP methyl ester carboxylesterase